MIAASHIAHVIVDRIPSDYWSMVAAKAAIGAVIFAGLTFVVAIIEVVLVGKDLRNNNEQLRAFRKHPKLEASLTVFGVSRTLAGQIPSWRPRELSFLISNEGDRSARSVTLEVLWIDNNTISTFSSSVLPVVMLDGWPYRLARLDVAAVMYPQASPITETLYLQFKYGLQSAEILYRLFDEFGVYPEDDYEREMISLES